MKGVSILFILAMAPPLVLGYCPQEKMRKNGNCSYYFECRGKLRGISLPSICTGSINYLVTINLALTEAHEKFADPVNDAELLTSVTSLKVSADWPQTKLAMLEYMPRLQNIILRNNNIKQIEGSPFYYLSRLESLDLSHNYLTNINELLRFETQSNKMKILSLANNAISEISGDAFGKLFSLVELDLSHNLISDLREEPFLNLTALETLKLNNNRIKDLNGAVNNLQNLKHLFLRGNEIQNIDAQSLKIINHLETFDISGNQLEYLKPTVLFRHWEHFGINSVCKIILSGNNIVSVPNTTSKEMFDRFTRSLKGRNFNIVHILTELDLSKNLISTIEYNAFQSLVRLVSLDLSSNKIIDFIVNPRDLEHVKYLNLSTNYITNLYFESFWSMNNLQNLDLSHNYLDNIPDQTFINNYNLKYVNMTYNDIKKLENLRIRMFHPEGGVLDLSKNSISKLNMPFGEGLRLTQLILRSNNVSDVTLINLNYQKELENLDLSRNAIEILDETSLHLPVTLSTLDLSYNLIGYIGPATFHTVSHLKTLRLAHNTLTKVEYGTFQSLTSLMDLDLSFNNISYLDSKVMMDLKSLRVLSLRFNGLYVLEYKGWLGHKLDLMVYLDGNNFTCEWLGTALSDFNNGYSKMRPTVLVRAVTGHSLEGIPCIDKEVGEERASRFTSEVGVMADERLLVIAQKILEAVREQNYYMKNICASQIFKK